MKQPHDDNNGAAILSQDKPGATENRVAKVARNRSKIVNLASRGRLSADIASKVNLDDDQLLDDVTRAARDAVLSETTLTDAVRACCAQDIDRDDVIESVIAGGFSESRARTVVSAVYCDAGKRVRKSGGGSKVSRSAIDLGQYALKTHESIDLAIKDTLAAYRWLKAERERMERGAKTSVTTSEQAVAAA